MPCRIRTIVMLLTVLTTPAAWAEVFRVGSDVHCTHPTLAAALAAAEANGPGRDEIRLSIDTQTTQARFSIQHSDVLIAGGYTTCGVVSPGAVARSLIVGNGHDTVFRIANGRNVELRQLAITNGGRHGMVNGDYVIGGAVWLDGGVVTLRGVRAMFNRGRLGGALAVTGQSVMVIFGGAGGTEIDHNEAMLGGGIYVGERATLRIDNDKVSVVHNSANGSSTPWDNAGGGIFATGSAQYEANVEVNWLTADPDSPMPTPSGFVLANNVSDGNGGGIALYGNATLNALEMTIRDNSAADSGGGIHLYGNQIGRGATAQSARLHGVMPGWLPGCDGQYGCNRITGNVAKRGGAVMVMHGELRLGQMLMAGNHSTGGGGAAISTGSIANVPSPVNRIWLDSMVIAGNQCSNPTPSLPCSTLAMGPGPNQVHIQHVTLADNVLEATSAHVRYEIYSGGSSIPLVLRSSILEPAPDVPLLYAGGPVDGDCLMAPYFSAIGSRPLARARPYGFVSRADMDYRPAAGDPAIDGCDTSQLDGSDLAGPDRIRHGSVDDPTVPNRVGPDSHADIGAFEKSLPPISDTIFRDDFEG